MRADIYFRVFGSPRKPTSQPAGGSWANFIPARQIAEKKRTDLSWQSRHDDRVRIHGAHADMYVCIRWGCATAKK